MPLILVLVIRLFLAVLISLFFIGVQINPCKR